VENISAQCWQLKNVMMQTVIAQTSRGCVETSRFNFTHSDGELSSYLAPHCWQLLQQARNSQWRGLRDGHQYISAAYHLTGCSISGNIKQVRAGGRRSNAKPHINNT
jgi:hypothetical protein